MRSMLGLVFVSSFILGACSGAESGTLRRSPSGSAPVDTNDPSGDTGQTGTTTAAIACPSDVAAPTALGNATDPADVHFAQGNVVYRDALKVYRIKPDGTGNGEIYTSANLIRSYADDTNLVAIEETPADPTAVIKIMPIGETTGPDGKPLVTAPVTLTPGWNAAGTYVFASDAQYLYFLADVPNKGDSIYKVAKQGLAMTLLAQLDAPLTDPLLSGTDVWFVRDARRVYKVAQTATAAPGEEPLRDITQPQPATEIFAMGYADCRLAVGGDKTYCSTGSALETRDLKGANVATVLDGTKAKAPFTLGPAMYTDTLLLRTLPSTAADPLKHGIRAVKVDGTAATEKTIACGREPIGAFAASASLVVWAEKGKGLFSAPR